MGIKTSIFFLFFFLMKTIEFYRDNESKQFILLNITILAKIWCILYLFILLIPLCCLLIFFSFARILGRLTKSFSECIKTIEYFQKEISLPWFTMFNHGSFIQAFGEQRPFFCLAVMTFTPSCNFSTCIQCLDLGDLRRD